MDKIAFARLIGFCVSKGASLVHADVEFINNIIDGGTPVKEAADFTGWIRRSEVSSEVDTLMRGMRDGRKIEAIKACRMLTGLGLKEAKDLVESVKP